MILLFTGDDRTLIQHQIKHLLKEAGLSRLDNINDCRRACLKCLSRGIDRKASATLLEVCIQDLAVDLNMIPRLAKSKNLLFIICEGFSTKTKLGKALKAYIISNVSLPNNWNKKNISRAIDFYAKQHGLTLSSVVIDYLYQALNNDFALLNSGLSTLALLSNDPPLELVKQIIPSQYATAIELKELILARKIRELPQYIQKLQGLVPDRVIITSLATQFTLLMQTAIAIEQNLNDREVAKFANIRNVNRLYFIKRELRSISVEQLVWLNTVIRDTKLKLQFNRCDLSARLILMCCY